MPRRQRRQPARIVGQPVAAPDHVQVRPHQQKVGAVDIARARVVDGEH